MKKILYILVIFYCSILQTKANILEKSSKIILINFQDSNWENVYEKDGLIVYLKVKVLPEGRFIAYKYENSTDKEISFSLELLKNNKTVSNNKMGISLKQNSSEIFFDPTDTVQLSENESIDGYTIKIN